MELDLIEKEVVVSFVRPPAGRNHDRLADAVARVYPSLGARESPEAALLLAASNSPSAFAALLNHPRGPSCVTEAVLRESVALERNLEAALAVCPAHLRKWSVAWSGGWATQALVDLADKWRRTAYFRSPEQRRSRCGPDGTDKLLRWLMRGYKKAILASKRDGDAVMGDLVRHYKAAGRGALDLVLLGALRFLCAGRKHRWSRGIRVRLLQQLLPDCTIASAHLVECVRQGRAGGEDLELLVRQASSLDVINQPLLGKHGATSVLHHAIAVDNKEAVQQLLRRNAEVSQQALMATFNLHSSDIAEMVVAYQIANIGDYSAALAAALTAQWTGVVRLLLEGVPRAGALTCEDLRHALVREPRSALHSRTAGYYRGWRSDRYWSIEAAIEMVRALPPATADNKLQQQALLEAVVEANVAHSPDSPVIPFCVEELGLPVSSRALLATMCAPDLFRYLASQCPAAVLSQLTHLGRTVLRTLLGETEPQLPVALVAQGVMALVDAGLPVRGSDIVAFLEQQSLGHRGQDEEQEQLLVFSALMEGVRSPAALNTGSKPLREVLRLSAHGGGALHFRVATTLLDRGAQVTDSDLQMAVPAPLRHALLGAWRKEVVWGVARLLRRPELWPQLPEELRFISALPTRAVREVIEFAVAASSSSSSSSSTRGRKRGGKNARRRR